MDEGFNKIKNLRFEIKDTLSKLTAKKDIVRGYYNQYIEKNKKNKMFGLDSFHFQSKLIELEYKQLNEHYIFIDNRIYCDYYKLYNILIAFYKQNFNTYTKQRNYPIYKDLEPFKQFDFDDINNIHYEIIEMIQHAYDFISKNNDEMKFDKQKLKSGFNIDNYVHNNIYKYTILLTNINLYENYLKSYHIYHMNFLKNLLGKLGLFRTQLSTVLNTDPIIESENINSTKFIERDEVNNSKEFKITIDRGLSRFDELSRYEEYNELGSDDLPTEDIDGIIVNSDDIATELELTEEYDELNSDDLPKEYIDGITVNSDDIAKESEPIEELQPIQAIKQPFVEESEPIEESKPIQAIEFPNNEFPNNEFKIQENTRGIEPNDVNPTTSETKNKKARKKKR